MSILGFALALALHPSDQAAADPAPVVAAERAFAADFPALGLGGSFTKWSRPDAVIIGGGGPRTVAEAFADAPRVRGPDEPLIEWWPVFAGVARSGELGFTTGPAAQDGVRYGHYFTVWRRQDDGAWRWVYDGGSGASAADQPGPETEPRFLKPATAWAESPEAAWREVAEAEAALAAEARGDQAAAHLARMADDGVLYVAPLAPATGAEAQTAALPAWPATFDFGEAVGGGASDGGDLVWTYGPAAWSRDGRVRQGHYVRLWQKRVEGWRIVMAQLIAPAPPPATGS